MKKILLIALTLFSVQTSFAQGKINPMKLQGILLKDDHMILNFNYNGFTEVPPGIDVKWYSRGFELLMMNETIFGESNFSFGYGFGLTSQNYFSDGAIVYDSLNHTSFQKMDFDYDLNKLALNYVDFAAELRFRTKPDADHRKFKMAVGFKAGYLFNDHTKFEKGDVKQKVFNIKNLNAWHYGVSLRFGGNKTCLTAFYSLSPLFEKDKGPELTAYSVGLSFRIF